MAPADAVVDRDQRDAAILRSRVGGLKLREIGERWGMTPEGISYAFDRAADNHMKRVVADMHAAQDDGGFLLQIIKGKTAEELAEPARFGAWVLEQLPRYGVDAEVHVTQVIDALVVSLYDRNYQPQRGNE